MPTILKLRSDKYEVKPGLTIRQAMIRLDIRPEEVIPIRDGELIAEDEIIHEGETIRLVPVISGGRHLVKRIRCGEIAAFGGNPAGRSPGPR